MGDNSLNNNSFKFFNFSIDSYRLKEDSFKVAQFACPDMFAGLNNLELSDGEVRVKIFEDGISNSLLGFYTKDDWSDMILVRRYGENTEVIVDREAEIKNMMLLHKHDLAPPLYCRFNNGICYGFIPGTVTTIDTIRQPHICKLVAVELARFHRMSTQQSNVTCDNTTDTTKSQLYDKIDTFLTLAKDICIINTSSDKKNNHIHDYERRCSENYFVKTLMEKHLVSPIVFCHNDLLLGNVIITQNGKHARFIDFEYGFTNYAAFDIGDHFSEWVGIRAIDDSLFPTKSTQLQWIRWYLEALLDVNDKDEGTGDASSIVTDELVNSWYADVQICIMAAHFFWATWSLAQAKFSKIDFDYMDYAEIKFRFYYECKEKIVKDYGNDVIGD